MITRENIKELLLSFDKKEIQKVIYEEGDSVLLTLHTFNVGSYLTIISLNYTEEIAEEAFSNGNVMGDKAWFVQTLEECEINWKL